MQVFIYSYEEDIARIFLFYFNKICNNLTHSFQNHYSKQTNHPHQDFPYGKIMMSH